MKFSEIPHFSFSSHSDFFRWFEDEKEAGYLRFEITEENILPFCGMFRRLKTSKNLLVLFNGAVNREKHNYESYQRWSWIEDLPYNVLILPDNTLAQGVFSLGWGLGSPNSWFVEVAVKFIQSLSDLINVNLEETVLYGSSAGGFQAFQCGIQLKKTTVVMENPQTDVFRYYEHHYMPMVNSTSFGDSVEEISSKFGLRVSLMNSISHHNFIPRTIYIQNLNDFFHEKNHLSPFRAYLEQSHLDSTMIQFVLSKGEQTHSPGGFDKFLSIMIDAFSTTKS